MDITSPFFVVPLIAAVFATCILWSTSSHSDGEAHH
jgi:paraquat-inducible protein B